MPRDVAHFLLTRFNVQVDFGSSSTRLAPSWLDGRWDLFERFCLPSVSAQTTRDFEWLVLFDAETPAAFREAVAARSGQGRFRPLYCGPSWRDELRATLAPLVGGASRVITTRLDSDDAIASPFMESVRRKASPAPGVLAFPRGLVLSGSRVYLHDYPANPFPSLVEDAAELKTVFMTDHDRLREFYRVDWVSESPSWLQVIHGGNAANAVKGIRLCGADRLAERGFCVRPLPPGSPDGAAETVLDFLQSLSWWKDALGPLRRAVKGS